MDEATFQTARKLGKTVDDLDKLSQKLNAAYMSSPPKDVVIPGELINVLVGPFNDSIRRVREEQKKRIEDL